MVLKDGVQNEAWQAFLLTIGVDGVKYVFDQLPPDVQLMMFGQFIRQQMTSNPTTKATFLTTIKGVL